MVKDKQYTQGEEEMSKASGLPLPYPVTPISPRPQSQAADGLFDRSGENLHIGSGSNSGKRNTALNQEDTGGISETVKSQKAGDVPEALRVGQRKSMEQPKNDTGIPTALRPGRSGGESGTAGQRTDGISHPIWQNPSTAASSTTYQPQSLNNPFIRQQDSGGDERPNTYTSNASVWQHQTASTQPSSHQPPLFNSQDQIFNQQVANLSLEDPSQSRTSLQEPSNLIGPHDSTPAVSLTTASPPVPSPPVPNFPPQASHQTPVVDRPHQGRESVTSLASNRTGRSDSSAGWDPGADITSFDAFTSRGHGLPGVSEDDEVQQPHRTWEEQQAWENSERERRQNEAALAAAHAQQEERERLAEEEWFKGEEVALRQAEPGVRTSGGVPERRISNTSRAQMASKPTTLENEQAPPVPPRTSNEESESRQRTEGLTNTTPSNPLAKENATKKIRQQKKEVYQIKQVNWTDVSKSRKTRKSPILIQNLNGPCPLLALVNALTLSTPADLNTPLIETLRSREQVTLGLLLDAVFDELMSGRRGDAAQELPNISDLYAFLVTLHSGMNVNPRFIRGPGVPNGTPESLIQTALLDDPSLSHDKQPGSFEDTRELKLYSTFSVPLIHGWLPSPNERAYEALERSAVTYEDAQNLMFREEELEEKVRGVGINEDERVLLEDISTVQTFLRSSATQLTPYGLDIIQSSMKKGSIAILFRNDHFSTLYKHPQSGQLLQLVTDAGYVGHDEIVWESLVDVNGERCEFFAGDFRPVGNSSGDTRPTQSQGQANDSLLDDDEGWTTVERSSARGQNRRSGTTPANANSNIESTPAAPFSPSTEQEDHDLALALQLQEEEEDRDRRENEARRREEDLSRTYLSSQATSSSPPTLRGRRSSNRRRTQEIRPLVPPREAPRTNRASNIDEGSEAPPPTYEQAANGPPYIPPEGHIAHAGSPPLGGPTRPPLSTTTSRTSQQSAYAQNAAQFVLPHSQQYPGVSGRGRANQRAGGLRSQAQGLLHEVQSQSGSAPLGARRRRDDFVQPPAEEKCTMM